MPDITYNKDDFNDKILWARMSRVANVNKRGGKIIFVDEEECAATVNQGRGLDKPGWYWFGNRTTNNLATGDAIEYVRSELLYPDKTVAASPLVADTTPNKTYTMAFVTNLAAGKLYDYKITGASEITLSRVTVSVRVNLSNVRQYYLKRDGFNFSVYDLPYALSYKFDKDGGDLATVGPITFVPHNELYTSATDIRFTFRPIIADTKANFIAETNGTFDSTYKLTVYINSALVSTRLTSTEQTITRGSDLTGT